MIPVTAWIMLDERFVTVIGGVRQIAPEAFNYVSQSADATGVAILSVNAVSEGSAYHCVVSLNVRDTDHLKQWKEHISAIAEDVATSPTV